MRCLLPTGIRVAEGWRGTSFPYIQKQFATLVSRQQDILICLYAVKQTLAAQCLSELFLMPAPRAGWGDTRLSSGVLCGGPCSADNSCITSHAALPSPCTVPARRFGQAAVGRVMRSLPLFIPGAMGSPGEQGRAEGTTDPRSPRWCLFCFRRWGRRGGAARSRDRAPGRGGGNCPRRAGTGRAGLREWCGQRGRSIPLGSCPTRGLGDGQPPARWPPFLSFPPPAAPRALGSPDALRSQFSSPALLLR